MSVGEGGVAGVAGGDGSLLEDSMILCPLFLWTGVFGGQAVGF